VRSHRGEEFHSLAVFRRFPVATIDLKKHLRICNAPAPWTSEGISEPFKISNIIVSAGSRYHLAERNGDNHSTNAGTEPQCQCSGSNVLI
jgi:hypothetical protein